jgi:hypothetical protein
MSSLAFPTRGLQARRKSDGVLGEVYASDPERRTITVRWPTIPGTWAMKRCTQEQFEHDWELTGAHLAQGPYHSNAAPIAIGVFSFVFLVYVLLHNSGARYTAYEFPRNPAEDSPATLNSAEALDAKYGIGAADHCAAGADDYIRSIASHRFQWDDTGMFQNKFDSFEPVVDSPGVLTLTSRKARLSNGFGVFSPIEIFCNYDTQTKLVLSYASRPEPE